MNSLLSVNFTNVSMGLVIISLVITWVLGLALGGFKVGRLERRINVTISRGQLPGFLLRFQQRAMELGFRTDPAMGDGHYLQGGKDVSGIVAGFTHAKTLKRLSIAVTDAGEDEVIAELTICFLDPIVGDTGESAYRDAVLNYVSGQADTMLTVRNRSFAAFSSLVGGVIAWVALFGLKAIGYSPLLPVILTVSITEILAGALAIVVVSRRRNELTGIGLAIGGIIASVSVAVFAIALR